MGSLGRAGEWDEVRVEAAAETCWFMAAREELGGRLVVVGGGRADGSFCEEAVVLETQQPWWHVRFGHGMAVRDLGGGVP
jgi:hypothetical protein